MKRKMTRIASLILAVIVMLCPLSVCFAAGETVLGDLAGEFIIETLWETLKGWGIQIVESGYTEITENVRQWLTGQLYEYLEDEVHEAFDYWITGMQFFRDQFGRLIGNDEYIKAADEFAEHLRTAFGITSNATIYLEASYQIGDIDIYQFPVYCFIKNGSSAANIGESIVKIDSSSPSSAALWAVPYSMNNYSDGCLILANQSGVSVSYSARNIESNNAVNVGSGQMGQPTVLKQTNWYTKDIFAPSSWNNENQYVLFDGVQMTKDQIYAILAVNSTVEGEGIQAVSKDILFPSNDPSYQEGYSIIYYPDGSIGYLDINWPDTISVDNLPAIVSSGTVADPGIKSVFLPIKSFINTFEDGFGLVTQLVYNLPSEIVGMALAIMGAIIIFGTIRIMKEH